MKRILFALALLISFSLKAQYIQHFPHGNPTSIDSFKGSVDIDHDFILSGLATSDTNKVLGINDSGKIVLRVKNSSGGGSSYDTTYLYTVLDSLVRKGDSGILYVTPLMLFDTANSIRSWTTLKYLDKSALGDSINVYLLNYYTKNQTDSLVSISQGNLTDSTSAIRSTINANQLLNVKYADSITHLFITRTYGNTIYQPLGSYWINGGNNFGGTSKVGLTTSDSLEIIENNKPVIVIQPKDSSGNHVYIVGDSMPHLEFVNTDPFVSDGQDIGHLEWSAQISRTLHPRVARITVSKMGDTSVRDAHMLLAVGADATMRNILDLYPDSVECYEPLKVRGNIESEPNQYTSGNYSFVVQNDSSRMQETLDSIPYSTISGSPARPLYNPNYLFQIRSEYPIIPFTSGEGHSQYYPTTMFLNGKLWASTKGDNLRSISSEVSTDNGNSFTFTKFALRPVSTTGLFDNYQVTTPTRYYDSTENADSLYLFYTGIDLTFINYGIGIASTDTAHPDTFVRMNTTPILSYQDIQNAGWCVRANNVNCSQVFKYKGMHYMYFYYLDSVANQYNIGLAHSAHLSYGWSLDKIIYRAKAPYMWAWRLQTFKFDDDSLYYGRVTLVTPLGLNGRIASVWAKSPIDTFYDLPGAYMETRQDTSKFDYSRLYQGAFTLQNDGSLHLAKVLDTVTKQYYALYFYSGSSQVYQPGGVRYDRAGMAKMYFQYGIDSDNRYLRGDVPIDVTASMHFRGQNGGIQIDTGYLQQVTNNDFYFPVLSNHSASVNGSMMIASKSQVLSAIGAIPYTDTGTGKAIETIKHAANTYQPKGSYITSETDPIWVADSSRFAHRGDSIAGGFYPYSSNPLGYLTSFTETDPIYSANGLKYTDTTSKSVTITQLNDSFQSKNYVPYSDTGNHVATTSQVGDSMTKVIRQGGNSDLPTIYGSINGYNKIISGNRTSLTLDSNGNFAFNSFNGAEFWTNATNKGGIFHPYGGIANPDIWRHEITAYINGIDSVQLGEEVASYIGDSNSTYKYANYWLWSTSVGAFRHITKFMIYPTVNVNVNDVLIQNGYGSNVTPNTALGTPSPSYNLPSELYVINTSEQTKPIITSRFNAGQTGYAWDATDSINVYAAIYPYGKAYFTDTIGTKTRAGAWEAYIDTLGDVVGVKIIKSGGTSSQFLKADGSTDASTYLTANQSITWTAAGDISGSASGATSITPTLTVTKVQGNAFHTGAPTTNGQYYSWNTTNSDFELTSAPGGSGTVTSVAKGIGLVNDGTITTSGTINVDTAFIYTYQHAVSSIAWSAITGTPTTLSGYGITNGVTNTTTVNGHALSSNVTVTSSDLGLSNAVLWNNVISGNLDTIMVHNPTSYFLSDVNPTSAPTPTGGRWMVNQYNNGISYGYEFATPSDYTINQLYFRKWSSGHPFTSWNYIFSNQDTTGTPILSTPTSVNAKLASYAGTSNIITLGTITTGTWHGTAIANTYLANSTISGVSLGSNLNALTISSPLTGTSYNGSGAVSIGIQTASGSQAGALSSTDWTTFNNKIGGVAGQYLKQYSNNVATDTSIQTLTDGTTITYNMDNGLSAKVTLGGNRTLSVTNPHQNSIFILKVIQDATGSRTMTWPANFKWPAGTAPTLTTTASHYDIITGWYDGTNWNCNYTLDVK